MELRRRYFGIWARYLAVLRLLARFLAVLSVAIDRKIVFAMFPVTSLDSQNTTEGCNIPHNFYDFQGSTWAPHLIHKEIWNKVVLIDMDQMHLNYIDYQPQDLVKF